MSLFERGDFSLHSGLASGWKIECDALTDSDLDTLAWLFSLRRSWATVISVPTGGDRFAEALRHYIEPTSPYRVVADDVLTTGASMEEVRRTLPADHRTLGVVIFARSQAPGWITPIFRLSRLIFDQTP